MFVLGAADEDAGLVPDIMPRECVTQCWFHFLHIYSDPVDLSHPDMIASTPKFVHLALTSNIDPVQHESLQKLPDIFHKAMKGVSTLVNAFLGESRIVSTVCQL